MEEKLKKILNDNDGYVTTRKLEENGIKKQYISNLTQSHLLWTISHKYI